MKSRRPRRPLGEEEDEHPDERWMASYMDMVTVLMCMFIVLFAMSTVDAAKFQQLANSLATGFGVARTQTVDTAEGVVVPPELIDEEGQGFTAGDAEEDTEGERKTDLDLAIEEVSDLRKIQEKITKGLQEEGLEKAVRFQLDERGLTVRLIGSETFFEPDSPILTRQTIKILNVVGPVLKPVGYELKVEGHTAQVRHLDPGALDWELSSERAVNVLRHLVEDSGVVSNRISAVGFGESRPLKTSGSDEDLAMNRRVDIVVLSGQPEAIRNLMPEVLKDPAGAAKDAAAERAEAVQKAAEADAAAKAAAEAAEAEGSEGESAERVAGEPGAGGSGGGEVITGGNGTVGPGPSATYAPAPGGKSDDH